MWRSGPSAVGFGCLVSISLHGQPGFFVCNVERTERTIRFWRNTSWRESPENFHPELNLSIFYFLTFPPQSRARVAGPADRGRTGCRAWRGRTGCRAWRGTAPALRYGPPARRRRRQPAPPPGFRPTSPPPSPSQRKSFPGGLLQAGRSRRPGQARPAYPARGCSTCWPSRSSPCRACPARPTCSSRPTRSSSSPSCRVSPC